MGRIELDLPDSLEKYVDEQVSSGEYNGRSEYIHALVQKDQERKEQAKASSNGVSLPVPEKPFIESVEDEDFEFESIQPTRHRRRVLFSDVVELRTENMRRWKPHISTDDFATEGEDV